jgi:hypothetical protein
MKVDLAESEDKRQTNKTRLQKIKSTISSTMYLLRSLFENFGCIAKLHKEIVNEIQRNILCTQEIIFSMDKRNVIIFLAKESSMKRISMTKLI